MKRQAKNYSIISCFIIALLINAMMPAFAALLPNSKVLLCTSQGYEWVELQIENSELSENVSENVSENEGIEHCLLCLVPADEEPAYIESNIAFPNLEKSNIVRLSFSHFDSFKAQFLDYIPPGRAPPLSA